MANEKNITINRRRRHGIAHHGRDRRGGVSFPDMFPISTYGAGFALNLVGIVIFLTGLVTGFVFRASRNRWTSW